MNNATFVGAAEQNFDVGTQQIKKVATVNHLAMDWSASNVTAHFHDPAAQVSSNYLNCEDGTLLQFVADENTAFANGPLRLANYNDLPWLNKVGDNLYGANPYTWSIEHIGAHKFGKWLPLNWGGKSFKVWTPGDDGIWWEPSDEQFATDVALQKQLLASNNIKPSRASITLHSDYDSVVKNYCAGKGMPLADLIAAIASPGQETLTVDYGAAKAKLANPKIKDYATISPQVFKAVLTEAKSPAARVANRLYQKCVNRFVNPALALAFFLVESSFGTDSNGLFGRTNNWGNILADRSLGSIAASSVKFQLAGYPQHAYRKYNSMADGLEDWINLWSLPIYSQLAGQPNELLLMLQKYTEGGYQSYYNKIMKYLPLWLDRSCAGQGGFTYEGPIQ